MPQVRAQAGSARSDIRSLGGSGGLRLLAAARSRLLPHGSGNGRVDLVLNARVEGTFKARIPALAHTALGGGILADLLGLQVLRGRLRGRTLALLDRVALGVGLVVVAEYFLTHAVLGLVGRHALFHPFIGRSRERRAAAGRLKSFLAHCVTSSTPARFAVAAWRAVAAAGEGSAFATAASVAIISSSAAWRGLAPPPPHRESPARSLSLSPPLA